MHLTLLPGTPRRGLLGWPCVGAQAGAFARIVAGAPAGVQVLLVPRGSTVGTAAAADAHEAAQPKRM